MKYLVGFSVTLICVTMNDAEVAILCQNLFSSLISLHFLVSFTSEWTTLYGGPFCDFLFVRFLSTVQCQADRRL